MCVENDRMRGNWVKRENVNGAKRIRGERNELNIGVYVGLFRLASFGLVGLLSGRLAGSTG
jgi:hypothetical protein